MTKPYGCHDRAPFAPHYLPTGAPDTQEYRIPHVWGQSCEYRHSNLGKTDPGCTNCKHKEQK